MAGRLRRTVIAVSLVALLLPMAAATSLADTGPAPTESFKFSSNGYSAEADQGQCSDPVDDIVTCTFTFILVFSGNAESTGLRRNPRDGGVLQHRHRCLQPGHGRGHLGPGKWLYPGPGRRDRHRARPERRDHRADHDHPRNLQL